MLSTVRHPDRQILKGAKPADLPIQQAERSERAIVQNVFTMAASGLGNGKIVAKLVERGAPAPGRKGWSKQVIRTLLSNCR